MGGADSDARRLAKVIGHPVRARIISLLGERGPLGWKELSTQLGVKTGALYHHLDALEGLVVRDQSKKYALTKSGMIVYSRTSEAHTIEAVRQAAAEIGREGGGARLAAALFIPRSLLGALVATRPVSALVFAALAGGLAIFSYIAGASPALYYLHPDPGLFQTLGSFAVSFAAVLLVAYASARYLFRSGAELLPLAAVSSLSFLPVFALFSLELIPSVATLFASSTIGFTLVLVFFQTWGSAILGAGLSVVSGVRVERTLLVSLVVLYATMVVMLLQGPKV